MNSVREFAQLRLLLNCVVRYCDSATQTINDKAAMNWQNMSTWNRHKSQIFHSFGTTIGYCSKNYFKLQIESSVYQRHYRPVSIMFSLARRTLLEDWQARLSSDTVNGLLFLHSNSS